MLRGILRLLLKLVYRVDVRGLENYRRAGKRVLIVANHTSFIDALLLAVFLPEQPSFAINTRIARRWYFRPFLRLAKLFRMDPTNPLSLKSLIRFLRGNQRVVIFPEGRITVTGSLMKIYYGPGMVADRSGAMVLPVRIDGAQYTPFSRMRGRLRLRWFPRIRLSILPPRRIEVPAELRGRARRNRAGQALSDIMTSMMFETAHTGRSLFRALLDAAHSHGGGHVVAEDIQRQPMTYRQTILRSFVLARVVARLTRPGENVGVLLPNTTAAVLSFFGLQAAGRVPAMLNFTAGTRALRSACTAAQLRVILSSRQFVARGKLEDVVAALAEQAEIVYLEDLVAGLGLFARLRGLLDLAFARLAHRAMSRGRGPDDAAVVLFTSGSEGAPKGVVLSHRNILANCAQIAARVDYQAQDVILNALPMFHSFGLTAGTILPLISGMRVFLYPTPLHYRIVPEMSYDVGATILFGTNTFLKGYARFAHPYDFYTLRYVFAGAEPLQEETRRVWSDRFGVRVLEGYGATETSPVLASNTPMDNRVGTVGRLLPGIEYRLVPVPGVEEGQRLHVRGPNVMLGYLREDAPGQCQPPASECGAGWYDTGDIVSIDADGFLRIRGRARRFAKIGGEMISLAAVEAFVARAWPDHLHAVLAVADARKGEQLVLVTDCAGIDRRALQAAAREQGFGELGVPRRVVVVRQVPVLGTGKIDYPAAHALARGENSAAAAASSAA